ncbi:MAG: methyltransferase domain-containing protein [Pseudomonadota bacterium]
MKYLLEFVPILNISILAFTAYLAYKTSGHSERAIKVAEDSVDHAKKTVDRSYATPTFQKRIDVLVELNGRYGRLIEDRNSILSSIQMSESGVNHSIFFRIRAYYQQYFQLHADEFHLFSMGLLDHYTYSLWLRRLLYHFRQEKTFEGWNASDAWDRFGHPSYQYNLPFTRLIGELYERACVPTVENAESDMQFIWQIIVETYNSEEISGYREKMQDAKQPDDGIAWFDIGQKLLPPENEALMQDAKAFNETVDHEKDNILAPALKKLFSDLDGIETGSAMLDYGCGTFRLSQPLREAGYEGIVGYDIDNAMLREAKLFYRHKRLPLTRDFTTFSRGQFDLVFLSFVHQYAPDSEKLERMFVEASSVLRDDGVLVVVGADPRQYGKRWSCMEVRANEKKLGAPIDTTIYSFDGRELYKPDKDHYWSIGSINRIVQEKLGMDFILNRAIPDKPSQSFSEEDIPEGDPYMALVYRKIKS